MLAIYLSILSISPAERIVDTKKQSFNFSYFRVFSLIFIITHPQDTGHHQMQFIGTLFLILFEKVAKICSMLKNYG
jgi:hypothetical protein